MTPCLFFFVTLCVVDDERERDHLFFDDARCSISFAEKKCQKYFRVSGVFTNKKT